MVQRKEKEFKIEQVASVIEVCFLTDPEDVFELCSFIMGEEITPGNIREKSDEMTFLIKEQYPTMERSIFLSNGDVLSKKGIEKIVNKYKSIYGEKINIKSKSIEKIKHYKKEGK